MYLTKDQEKMLENPETEKCMKLLIAVGKVFEAENLIKTKSVHISGISYQNIGDAGLEWLEELSEFARFKIKATVNPAGMDLRRWREMRISKSFYEKQVRILKALEKMGARLEMSCIPYCFENISYGDDISWAESNAVIYANSVIGARTNRESCITAIASAVTGLTPKYGMHLDENRKADVIVKLPNLENFGGSNTGDDLEGVAGIIGYLVGKILKEEIPMLICKKKLTHEELKAIGAAMAATGGKAIFHVEGQTPEWDCFEKPKEKIEIDKKDFDDFRDKFSVISKSNSYDLNSFKSDLPDLIAIGCPHAYKKEIIEISKFAEKHKFKREFWVFTCRRVLKDKVVAEAIKKIENAGGKVFCDTCMVVSPATEQFECVMVNSGKALAYLPKLRKVKAVYGSLKECLKVSVS